MVTAISPTPAGEGKPLQVLASSMGYVTSEKSNDLPQRTEPRTLLWYEGGAAGGGHAQVIPMTDINLHFTGDFHAIGAAHNLLSALIDNHIHWDNELDIDPEESLGREWLI